jgi:TBC domain-containing protein kinase-like protein
LKIYDYLLISDESFEIVFACLIMLDLKSTFEIKDSEGMLGCLKNL